LRLGLVIGGEGEGYPTCPKSSSTRTGCKLHNDTSLRSQWESELGVDRGSRCWQQKSKARPCGGSLKKEGWENYSKQGRNRFAVVEKRKFPVSPVKPRRLGLGRKIHYYQKYVRGRRLAKVPPGTRAKKKGERRREMVPDQQAKTISHFFPKVPWTVRREGPGFELGKGKRFQKRIPCT